MEDNITYKICNFCGEELHPFYRRCPYCGSLLENVARQQKAADSKSDNAGNEENIVKAQSYAPPVQAKAENNVLSNRLKVFLTTLFVIIPGIGQIAGIITSVILMNSNDDSRSFGKALFTSCIVVFFITLLFYFLLSIAFSTVMNHYY